MDTSTIKTTITKSCEKGRYKLSDIVIINGERFIVTNISWYGSRSVENVTFTLVREFEEKNKIEVPKEEIGMKAGITLRMNKDGTWEKYEPYMTVDCPTEEDFKFLEEAIARHCPKKPSVPWDSMSGNFNCPNCHHEVSVGQNFCDICGQALDWTGGADDE